MVASRTSCTQSAWLSDMRASATAMFHSTCQEARRIACRGSATVCSDDATLSPLPCSSRVRGRRRRRPRCSITGHSTSSRAPFRMRVASGEGGVGGSQAGGDAAGGSDVAAGGATVAAGGAAAAAGGGVGLEAALIKMAPATERGASGVRWRRGGRSLRPLALPSSGRTGCLARQAASCCDVSRASRAAKRVLSAAVDASAGTPDTLARPTAAAAARAAAAAAAATVAADSPRIVLRGESIINGSNAASLGAA